MNSISKIEEQVRHFVERSGMTVSFNGKKIYKSPDLSKRRVFDELRITEEFAMLMDLELTDDPGHGMVYPLSDIEFRIPHVKLTQVAVCVSGRERPGQRFINQSMYLGMGN